MVKRISRWHIAFLLCGMMGASVAQAQEARIPARVTYIAGQNLYLDVGRGEQVLPDDTLAVFMGGEVQGAFLVISSMSDRSVVTFAGPPFPVTLGMDLELQVSSAEEAVPPAIVEDAPSETVVPADEVPTRDVGTQNAVPPRRTATATRRQRELDVSGRILLGLNTSYSVTEWTTDRQGDRGMTDGVTNRTSRTFATPSLGVNLNVRNLPGGLRFQTRLRTDYRYTSGRAITPTTSFRTYEAKLSRSFRNAVVEAGRFYNRYERFSGYWDGLLVRYAGDRAGIGTAVGFMPDRSNEGFSSTMPRYSAFADFAVGDRDGVRYSAEVSFNEVRPTNDLLTHRFAGLSQRVQVGAWSLRSDIQVDRDPLEGNWVASQFYVRSNVRLAQRLHLRGRYQVRRPYSIWRIARVIADRRDQASAGVTWQIARATLGGDLSLNRSEGTTTSRTWSGYIQHPDLGIGGLGGNAMVSYWDADRGTSLFINTGVTHRYQKLRTRVQYQFARTTTLSRAPLVTHAASVQVVVPLRRRLQSSTQVRVQQGASLRNVALNTSLWWSF